MSASLTILAGLGLLAAGLWGVKVTWPLCLVVVKAIVPLLCILGGILALLVGAGELRDSFAASERKGAEPGDGKQKPAARAHR